MKRARFRCLGIFLLMVFITPVRADDACHQLLSDKSMTPDVFAMMCTNKDDLSRVCENQVSRMGPESTDNYVVRFFITPNAPCKDKKSVQSFCSFVQSYNGYQILAVDAALVPDASDPDYANLTHPRDRAAKVCNTTPEAIRVNLCSKADVAKQWQFAYAACPVEGKQIFMRECLKPYVSDGEGGRRVVHNTEAECASRYKSIPKK